jgi:hypothetical protein
MDFVSIFKEELNRGEFVTPPQTWEEFGKRINLEKFQLYPKTHTLFIPLGVAIVIVLCNVLLFALLLILFALYCAYKLRPVTTPVPPFVVYFTMTVSVYLYLYYTGLFFALFQWIYVSVVFVLAHMSVR